MSMEHELRPCPLDVFVECSEPHVHVVFAIMDQVWGVVRDEKIDRREAGQNLLDLKILK